MGRIGATEAQGTFEWTGLLLLLCVAMTVAAHSISVLPGEGLFHSVQRSVLCAVSLSENCLDEGSLERAYGPEVASLVRENTPDILFGSDRLGLPVDFRSCRSQGCAEGPAQGLVGESGAGEPVTLFTRVIERDGTTWIQYWAYYPESASLRGVPVLEEKGFHRHDWESVQVRIGSDGEVVQRASSHAGYNHTRSVANWGSDMGSGFLRDVAEAAGLRNEGGWGEASGRWLVAGGSHAGNVDGETDPGSYPAWTPAYRIRLIPLEQVRSGPLARPADFSPITPPWRKSVWTNPESDGTG